MAQKLAEPIAMDPLPKRDKKRIRVYFDPQPFRMRARVFLHVNRRPLVAVLIIAMWLILAGLVIAFKAR